jgi:hypothetical protein
MDPQKKGARWSKKSNFTKGSRNKIVDEMLE